MGLARTTKCGPRATWQGDRKGVLDTPTRKTLHRLPSNQTLTCVGSRHRPRNCHGPRVPALPLSDLRTVTAAEESRHTIPHSPRPTLTRAQQGPERMLCGREIKEHGRRPSERRTAAQPHCPAPRLRPTGQGRRRLRTVEPHMVMREVSLSFRKLPCETTEQRCTVSNAHKHRQARRKEDPPRTPPPTPQEVVLSELQP